MKTLWRTVQLKLRRSYWKYLNGIFSEHETSDQAAKNKRFWSYISHQKSSNIGVSSLKKNGRMISDPKEQAEVLNQQFQSVFGNGREYTEDEFQVKTGLPNTVMSSMAEIIIIKQNGVQSMLTNLNPY